MTTPTDATPLTFPTLPMANSSEQQQAMMNMMMMNQQMLIQQMMANSGKQKPAKISSSKRIMTYLKENMTPAFDLSDIRPFINRVFDENTALIDLVIRNDGSIDIRSLLPAAIRKFLINIPKEQHPFVVYNNNKNQYIYAYYKKVWVKMNKLKDFSNLISNMLEHFNNKLRNEVMEHYIINPDKPIDALNLTEEGRELLIGIYGSRVTFIDDVSQYVKDMKMCIPRKRYLTLITDCMTDIKDVCEELSDDSESESE